MRVCVEFDESMSRYVNTLKALKSLRRELGELIEKYRPVLCPTPADCAATFTKLDNVFENIEYDEYQVTKKLETIIKEVAIRKAVEGDGHEDMDQ